MSIGGKITFLAETLILLFFGGAVLAQNNGQVTIGAVVRQEIENIARYVSSGGFAAVQFGETPMTINYGEAKTGSARVSISFQVGAASQTQISERKDFSDAVWEPFDGSVDWVLSSGDGSKTVYARFKSLGGWMTDTVFDSIVLDTQPPTNPGGFLATPSDKEITLNWKNPKDPDFQKVRIVRSDNFYPENPDQGTVVYDGPGEIFIDKELVNGVEYFYTAFSYDDVYNFSSGAVAGAKPGSPGSKTEIPETPVTAGPAEIEKLDLEQFEFIQNGKKLDIENGTVVVDRFQPLTILIPYEAVPEVLKTVMVTLKQGNQLFSFLMRVDKEKTVYAATLVPPDTGVYPFYITILDYENQALKKISGEMDIVKMEYPDTKIIQYAITRKLPPVYYILFFLLMVLAAEETRRYLKQRSRTEKIEDRTENPVQ